MSHRRSISPIGLEVCSRWIRAAQLTRTRGSWTVLAVASVPRPENAAAPSADEARRLAGVLERRAFRGSDVVLAAPPSLLIGSVLELPPMGSGAPVEDLAAAELARIHHRDAATLETVLWEIPVANRAAAGREYIAAACPHDAANAFLDPFEDAGLAVRALDLRQLALLRACAPGLRPPPGMDAILHMGADQCTLLIVSDGVIAYERTLEGGEGNALVKTVAERTGLDPVTAEDLLLSEAAVDPARTPERLEFDAELRDFATSHVSALCKQLGVSFSYISRRYAGRELANVLLTGEFAVLPGLSSRITSLGPEARIMPGPPGLDAGAGAHAVLAAIGLAMHSEKEAA